MFHVKHLNFMKIIDYSVTNEEFILKKNKKYDFLETFPKPFQLENYYKSEDYISHTDGKRTFFEFIYQLIKHFTIQQKVNLIQKFCSEKGNVIDVGAGTGDFLLTAKRNDWRIFGVEPSEKAREKAREKGVFLSENIGKIQKKANCITLWHALEHIPNLEETLFLLKNQLTENGILVIAVPNYKSKDAEIYKNFWAAYDVPRHLWHFSRKGLRDLLNDIGFEQIAEKPMYFDAFYVSLLSEKYKTGKMNFLHGILNGIRSNYHGMKTGEYSSFISIFRLKK